MINAHKYKRSPARISAILPNPIPVPKVLPKEEPVISIVKTELIKKERKKRDDIGKKRNKYDSTLPAEYKQYLMRANSKEMLFTLTIEEFYNITRQDCYYCGEEGPNGIDREDSKQGYIQSNCLPCCPQCNIMKYIHSTTKFLNKVRQIYHHQQQLSQQQYG